MSDGTINFPERSTHPDSPATSRIKLYNFNGEPYYKTDSGAENTLKGDQGVQGIQGPQGIQGIQGNVGPVGPMAVESLISETATLTLPNSETFQLVYSDSITVTADGNLFVDISLAVRPHSTGNDMIFEIDFDGVTLSPASVEEHKDTNATQSMWRAQTLDLGFKTAGTYDLDLYFRKEVTGGTAQLKNYTAKVVRY